MSTSIKSVEGKKITIVNRNIMLNNNDKAALIKILNYLYTKETIRVTTSLKGFEHRAQGVKQGFTGRGASLVEVFTKSKSIVYKNDSFKASKDNILNWREDKGVLRDQYHIQSFVNNSIIENKNMHLFE